MEAQIKIKYFFFRIDTKIILSAAFFFLFFKTHAQNEIISRVIFIGDAGEINHQQETIIPQAANMVIPDKTTVMFLGDNIYPRGMGLPGSVEEAETVKILDSQFKPMREKGATVYFIPGNHDWDRMGRNGLAKIRAQSNYLESQNDLLLQMLPGNGCPDPVDMVLSENLVLIAYDSEWWLFPNEKSSDDLECECYTEKQVLERLEELAYNHSDKTILLAGHHPFRSYGVHGGYFSLKDHLFPLALINKDLHIPLPGLGSLYPLLRKTVFLNPEDLRHPQYQKMISKISSIFEEYPNVIHVSGHDHGLQFIKEGDFIQVVSGSGSKREHIKQGENALYLHKGQGFVVIDQLEDKNIHVAYYTYEADTVSLAYEYIVKHRSIPLDPNELYSENSKVDSLLVIANGAYDQVGRFHRKLFGENYRKEWASETKLPTIQVSKIQGGLRPIKRGGGMQTTSLRMEDPTGKQWVLRSVNKNSDALLPEELQNTFARYFLDDANSAQHPYSALMVPPLANAAGVPHTNPIIGIVMTDSLLGAYNVQFANTLCLLEEREPMGNSDNTIKMLRKVNQDNDEDIKAKTFIRARMLDLLINDWDRHEDQWRWRDMNEELEKSDRDYLPVPRDRDQALRVMQGFLPYMMTRPAFLPTIQSFDPEIESVKYSLLKSSFLNSHPKFQLSYEEWMDLVNGFVESLSDSVLLESVSRLPKTSQEIRGERLFEILQKRRDSLPVVMEEYYRFINSIVDIKLSDKNELVSVEELDGGALNVSVRKINKHGEVSRKLMEKIHYPELTDEVRIYLGSGNDSLYYKATTSPIKVKIIGESGEKYYDIKANAGKVHVYDKGRQSSFSELSTGFRKHISNDSSHLKFEPVNLYNTWQPLISADINPDDGLLLGFGFKYTHQRGFRTKPFNYTQQFVVARAFNTNATRIKYQGMWKEAVGKADAIINARLFIPNAQNYFGLGNASLYDRNTNPMFFYRVRYSLYELDPALHWQTGKTSSFRLGPALQWYRYDEGENENRRVAQPGSISTYDSLTLNDNKGFGGMKVSFQKDNRNHHLFPTSGGYFRSEAKAFTGLNSKSRSFAQLNAELGFYIPLVNRAIILANRMGGGFTLGQTTFYQSQFLGSHDNLRGFRQFRYAGDHLLYNNLELRIKARDIRGYILPGQIGMIAFYDAGKVWADVAQSNRIHQGVGAGLYYAPARMAVLQLIAGYSREGWYPHFKMGFWF
ncbi:BamA/TamA family outer membrane protein [Belliella marina]|uniref:BamA/TamA family outer membrane protein n=1 Tax=Belliella marina TaxID=1644146 RepID=A0ABW4VPB5_9BACT